MAAERVFERLSGFEAYGKGIYVALASGSYVEQGRLVKKVSGSTIATTTAGDTPCGIAYGLRYSVYRPTSKFYANGEECAYLWGNGFAAWSAEFFVEGVLPAAGTTVYAGANGQLTTTAGSNRKVGIVEVVTTRTEATGGVGTSQNVAVVRCEITPYGTT